MVSLESHINDLRNEILKIKKEYPKKKLFLLGESMGGAIVLILNANNNFAHRWFYQLLQQYGILKKEIF